MHNEAVLLALSAWGIGAPCLAWAIGKERGKQIIRQRISRRDQIRARKG